MTPPVPPQSPEDRQTDAVLKKLGTEWTMESAPPDRSSNFLIQMETRIRLEAEREAAERAARGPAPKWWPYALAVLLGVAGLSASALFLARPVEGSIVARRGVVDAPWRLTAGSTIRVEPGTGAMVAIDGGRTTVAANGGTRFTIAAADRLILESGELWIDRAVSSPFTITTVGGQVTATARALHVAKGDDGMTVVLADGTATISGPDGDVTISPGTSALLPGGSRATSTMPAPAAVQPAWVGAIGTR